MVGRFAGFDRARRVGRQWAGPLGSRERSGTADRWVVEKPGLLQVSVCERAGREMVGRSAGFDVGVRPGRPVCAGSDEERAGCRMGERAVSAFVGNGVGFTAGGPICWFRGTPRESERHRRRISGWWGRAWWRGEIWEMGEILKMEREWRHPSF
jgi:hypothetical protein